MAEPAFVYENDIATTPGRLWAALTTGELTRQYWFDRRIESDWKVGSPVRFYGGASRRVTDRGQVLESDPPRRLSYTFRPEGQTAGGEGERGSDERPFTRVTFEISRIDDAHVRLRLVHDWLERPDDVEGWRQGWTPILTNLQAFQEKERG